MPRNLKAQPAVDFLISYGIAMLIIVITLAIIYNISIAHPALATPQCTGYGGFSCGLVILSANGTLQITLAQATGGPITIGGVGCSSTLNSTGNKPQYGNIQLSGSSSFYPTSRDPNGWVIFSGSSNTLTIYCYGPGGIASGRIDSPFTGYLWINYTIPSYGSITQTAAVFTARYS